MHHLLVKHLVSAALCIGISRQQSVRHQSVMGNGQRLGIAVRWGGN
jgi:hypothetical protein